MSVSETVLTREERDGLTIWGETISAQFRDGGRLALHLRSDAPRDDDGVVLVSPQDTAKLRALIEEADSRRPG